MNLILNHILPGIFALFWWMPVLFHLADLFTSARIDENRMNRAITFILVAMLIFGLVLTCLPGKALADAPVLVDARYNYEIYKVGNQQYRADISSIYRRDKYGNSLDVSWYPDGDEYISGYNFFIARTDKSWLNVDSSSVNGSWLALPELDGKFLKLKSVYIRDDFINSNYRNNILVYDYGLVKRNIRLIHGQLFSIWQIDSRPGNQLKINIEKTGNLKFIEPVAYDSQGLNLVLSKDNGNELLDFNLLDGQPEYPIFMHDSLQTFNPGGGVDGQVGQTYGYGAGQTWTTIRNAAGSTHEDAGIANVILWSTGDTVANRWVSLYRFITVFNTSSLPDTANITSANLAVYGSAKVDANGDLPDVNVYSQTTLSDTALSNADYSTSGVTPFSTAITYGDYDIGYNIFNLNAAGLAAISTTGYSKFCIKNANHDVADSTLTWTALTTVAGFGIWTIEKGAGYEPVLSVYYETKLPGMPYNLAAAIVAVDSANVTWTDNVSSNTTIIETSFDGLNYYRSYNGTAEQALISGLDLNSTIYYIRAFSQNEYGFSGYTQIITIGGDDMNLTLAISPFYLLLGFSLALLVIAALIKKTLIYVALVPCWIGVIILASRYADTEAIQAAAGVVIIYCIWQMRNFRKGVNA